jgi:hypothetical protein
MVQCTPVDTQRAHLGAQLCRQVLAANVSQVRGVQRGSADNTANETDIRQPHGPSSIVHVMPQTHLRLRQSVSLAHVVLCELLAQHGCIVSRDYQTDLPQPKHVVHERCLHMACACRCMCTASIYMQGYQCRLLCLYMLLLEPTGYPQTCQLTSDLAASLQAQEPNVNQHAPTGRGPGTAVPGVLPLVRRL